MSITDIRFRTAPVTVDGEVKSFVLLQVLNYTPAKRQQYNYDEGQSAWRDALVEDLLEVAKFTASAESLRTQVDELRAEITRMQKTLYPEAFNG